MPVVRLLGALILIAGCGPSMSAPVKMRNPRTGETAICGSPYGATKEGPGPKYKLIRDCIEDYQRQGWEKVRD
jgi:hypothetical protein